MSKLAGELRAIGRAINHEEYVDAGVVPLTLAHAANHIEALEAALQKIATNTWPGEYLHGIARAALDKDL